MLHKLGRFRGLMSGLVLASVIATPVFPQSGNKGAGPGIKPATAQVKPTAFKVNKRPPIPFKKFEMLDPQTGKPLSRDTKLPTLPNGKTMTAGEYYDKLNQLEAEFNKLGYTLRKDDGTKARIQEPGISKETLEAQAQKIRAAHMPATRIQKVALQATNAEAETLPALKALELNLVKLPSKSAVQSRSWSHTIGDPDILAAYISGKLELRGATNPLVTKVSVSAEGKAGGTIINHSFELVRVTGSLNSVHTIGNKDTVTAKLGVSVDGNNVYNLDKTANASYQNSDSVTKSIDEHLKACFPLGPIDVCATVGVKGKVGVGYSVSLAPLTASASCGPIAETKGYLQGGVGIGAFGVDIVEVGIGGSLTFLKWNPALEGKVLFGIDSNSKPYFKFTAELCHTLEMLSGYLYLYADVTVPCWDLPPWCDEHYELPIWDWSGIKVGGCLFKQEKKVYI